MAFFTQLQLRNIIGTKQERKMQLWDTSETRQKPHRCDSGPESPQTDEQLKGVVQPRRNAGNSGYESARNMANIQS